MSLWKRTLIISAVEIAAIVIIHAIMIRIFAGGTMVSVLFSAGDHVPRMTLLAVGAFLLVRIVFVFLPGLILARLGLAVMQALMPDRKRDI